MFNRKSSADEIAESMGNFLVEAAIDKKTELQSNIVKAAELLNDAAEIFDKSGMVVQSEFVTAILESLAKKKDKNKAKDKKNKKSNKKPMTSDKMVKNLKEKGWMFDESKSEDVNHSNDCAMCGDTAYADDAQEEDSDDELQSMLDYFKSKSDNSDMDFEDELDFDDFDDRLRF